MANFTQSWLFYALGSAFFAALTAILGKYGVGGMNSNLATFIRTVVILIVTAMIVSARGQWQSPARWHLFPVLMLVASGIATGLSWLCYYRALQLGPASKVAPVDKLSVALVVLLSVVVLRESLSAKAMVGACMITAGAVLMAL